MRRGTGVRRSWDVKRLGKALASQGMDLRHWVSYATVATINGDTGQANYTDSNAILITPAGVEIDVILEPSGYPVTCRFGLQAGAVFICTPIHPGDQVLVHIPDGDVSMVPVATSVVPGSSNPIPVGDDGMPVFRNDRALIAATGVPIELRTMGGVSLLVNPDGTIQLGAGADQKLIRGTDYRSAESTMNNDPITGLKATWTAAANACVGPTLVLKPMFIAAAAAIQVFEAQASGFLSDTSKTR